MSDTYVRNFKIIKEIENINIDIPNEENCGMRIAVVTLLF
jgi:hypothetical protein